MTSNITAEILMRQAKALSTRSKRFKTDVHNFLVHMAAFGEANDGARGDILAKLYNGLYGLGSQQKVKTWIEEFTPWRARQKKDSPDFTFTVAKKDAHWRVDAGRDNPWYEFSQEGDDQPKPMNIDELLKMVHRLAAQQEKKLEKGTIEVPDPAKYLAALEKVKAFTIKV